MNFDLSSFLLNLIKFKFHQAKDDARSEGLK